MTDIMQPRDNETYEEPEDEVQEVRVHAGFKKNRAEYLTTVLKWPDSTYLYSTLFAKHFVRLNFRRLFSAV